MIWSTDQQQCYPIPNNKKKCVDCLYCYETHSAIRSSHIINASNESLENTLLYNIFSEKHHSWYILEIWGKTLIYDVLCHHDREVYISRLQTKHFNYLQIDRTLREERNWTTGQTEKRYLLPMTWYTEHIQFTGIEP